MSPRSLGRNLVLVFLTLSIKCISLTKCQQDLELKTLVEDFWNWKLHEFPTANPHAKHLESFAFSRFQVRVNETKQMLQRAENIVTEHVSSVDLLTLKLLKYQLQTFIDGYRWVEYGSLNPLSMLGNVHILSYFWTLRSVYHTFDEYMEYIDKLNLVPVQLEEITDLLRRAVQLNRTNHIVSMKGVVESLNSLAQQNPRETIYYTSHFEDLDKSIAISASEKATLLARGEDAITRILKAIGRLAAWLNEVRFPSVLNLQQYLPHSRRHEGVWSLHNGVEYYRSLLRWHLSQDMHPETVHQTGKREVDRIKRKMQNVMQILGYEKDLTQFLKMLQSDPRFYNHTQDQYLNLYKEAMDTEIMPFLDDYFPYIHHIPKLRVIPAPEGSLMAAYSRNTVRVSTDNPEARSNFTVLTIAVHEGLPGHHLQVASMAQQDLPDFRRYLQSTRKTSAPFHFPYYTAYVEGWGLYAEYMAEEIGVFTNRYDLFGRYCFEMFRACRLVVDTGIHYKGWSKEEAVQYLMKYNIMQRHELEKEVDRYITWPGQACAYKIGELKFKQLKQRAQTELGEEFNIKEFHKAVLEVGAVSLDILEEVVTDWIQSQTPSNGALTYGSTLLMAFCSMFYVLVR